jgi:hypothetical protein
MNYSNTNSAIKELSETYFTNIAKVIYIIKLILVGGDNSLIFDSWGEVKNKLIDRSTSRSALIGG